MVDGVSPGGKRQCGRDGRLYSFTKLSGYKNRQDYTSV